MVFFYIQSIACQGATQNLLFKHRGSRKQLKVALSEVTLSRDEVMTLPHVLPSYRYLFVKTVELRSWMTLNGCPIKLLSADGLTSLTISGI